MKEVLLLAVTVFAAVLAADQRCLQKADTDSPHLVHENDCGKFYKCNENKHAVEQECPQGLEFNPLLLKCDYPRGFCTPISRKPVQHVMSCNGLSDGAYYPDLSDQCRSFYHCHNGIAKVSKCSDGSKFDSRTRTCIDENKVQCGQQELDKQDLNCDTDSSPKAHKDGGCKSYTECENGKSVRRFCEGSLIFNEQTKTCDWPQKVKCGLPAAIEDRTDTIRYSDFDEEICKGKPNKYIIGPNRNSKCASYYSCKNEQLVEEYCGDRLMFNWKLGVCDLPANIDGCNVDTNRKGVIDCVNKHSLRYRHPDDCSAYISCRVSQAHMHKCPKGQQFDDSEHACVADNENKCSKSTTTPDEYIELLVEPLKRKDKKKSNSYPNYANGCRSYFDCKKSRCQERSCQPNFAYNIEKLRCEPDDNVFCDVIDSTQGASYMHDRNRTTGIRGRATPSYIDCSVQQGTWYEDKADCRGFYVCVMGNAIAQKCHAGQFFDTKRKLCRAGNCGDGSIVTDPPKCIEGSFKPNLWNNTQYYQCKNGVWTEASCCAGEVFNPSTNKCESGAIVTSPPKCPEGSVMPNVWNKTQYYQCKNGVWTEASCCAGEIFNPSKARCESESTSTTCSEGATLPNAFNPAKYYRCENNYWREKDCLSGTYFNPTTGSCQSNGTTPGTCKDGEQKPNGFDNTKYYICQGGYWRERDCPTGTTYSPTLPGCVSDGITAVCTPKQAMPNAFNNLTYYECQGDNTWRLLHCPTNYVFNYVTLQCENTGLPPIVTPPITLPTTTESTTNPSVCTNGDLYPDNFDKTKFYVCYEKELRSQKCPENMKFNPTKLYCELANTACGSTPHGGFAPASDPNKYYVCANGDMVLQQCPQYQQFNPMLGYCTKFRPLPPPPPPPPPPITLNCGPVMQGAFVADITDETKYYICVMGKLWSQSCPQNMIFNNFTNVCIRKPIGPPVGGCGNYPAGTKLAVCDERYPDYYLLCIMGVFILKKCDNDKYFSSNDSDCTLTPGNGECGSHMDGAAWPDDPTTPNTYLQCADGKVISRTCPDNMIFNSASNFCVNPCAALTTTSGYAQNPNNPSYYYVCRSGLVNGVSTPITTNGQMCPGDQQFYPAFGALDSSIGPCYDNIATLQESCPSGPSTTLLPLYGPACPTSISIYSPFYLECTNGNGIVQKCPTGYILYAGVCKVFRSSSSSIPMDCSTTPLTEFESCICGIDPTS